MEIGMSMFLQEYYARCPECKSQLIGNGEGTLLIDEGLFQRTCRCGFKVTVTIKKEKNLYLKKARQK